jgi:hypothetical protein
MRGRAGYLVSATAFVCGVGGGLLIPGCEMRGMASKLQQVVVPGEHTIALAEAGVHTIFHEHRTTVGGRYFAGNRELNGVSLRLKSLPAGENIPLDTPGALTQYALADREGSSIATFRVGEPGLYRLSAWYPESASGTTAVLSIGQGVERRLRMATFESLALILAGVSTGGAIAIATFARGRRRIEDSTGIDQERRTT